jgi:hypothetical protein
MSQVQILSPRPIIEGLGDLTAIASGNGLNRGVVCEQRGGSNPSDPTIPNKKGGTVGPVSYIITGTPDDGCGTEHGLAAMRSAL